MNNRENYTTTRHSRADGNGYPKILNMLVASVFDVAVDVEAAFELRIPLEALPFVRGRKWIRKLRCLSAASFEAFPFFALHKWEPEGQRIAVAFFGIPFLAKQERYVAAGLPPACNLKTATELSKTY